MEKGLFTERDQVILREVEDALEERGAGSFVLTTILFAMVADGLRFDEAVMDYGCVMFTEKDWKRAYDLIDMVFLARGIDEHPDTWLEELAGEVKYNADRVLARQGN